MTKEDVTFSQDYVVRTPRDQGIIPVLDKDWKRLRRMVEAIVPPKRIFQVLGSISVSLSGSSLLALIAFLNTEALDPWVVPTTMAIMGATALMGGSLFWQDRQQRQFLTTTTEDVTDEMDDIEATYEQESAEPASGEGADDIYGQIGEWPGEQLVFEFLPGQWVRHPSFGVGVVETTRTFSGEESVTVKFRDHGTKDLLAKAANMEKITKADLDVDDLI